MDIFNSKWAPKVPHDAKIVDRAKARKIISRVDEFQKCKKLFKRLQWKASHLLISYKDASTHNVSAYEMTVTEIRAMFKIDFFEFYVLLERLLVHLLGVFRVSVSRVGSNRGPAVSTPGPHRTNGLDVSQRANHSIIGNSNLPTSFHRFHAEVLEAFDQPENPLHEVFGIDPTRNYLHRAKDFRNKWKDTAESDLLTQSALPEVRDDRPLNKAPSVSMEDVDLDRMLFDLLRALRDACDIAERHIRESADDDGPYLIPENVKFPGWISVDDMDIDGDEFPYEAIPDGMDWQYG